MDQSSRSSSNKYRYDAGTVTRMDVVSGLTGRRRWPDDVKAQIVADSFSSDRPVSEVARCNGLVPSQLFTWRRLARAGKLVLPGEDEALFAPLLIEGAPASAPALPEAMTHGTISIEADGLTLRLAADTPAQRIAEIMHALKAPS